LYEPFPYIWTCPACLTGGARVDILKVVVSLTGLGLHPVPSILTSVMSNTARADHQEG
jgi:hypothetical protein